MSLDFSVELPRRDFLLHLEGQFEEDVLGIYGPSGAGKTTFFRLLAGLDHPQTGHIYLNDRPLVDVEKKIFVPPYQRRMGVVFQEKLLFPHMNIEKNLTFGQKYTTTNRVSLNKVVELLDLGPLLKSMPVEISGGEQQRVAIGRALLTSPELLLLDEPFNAVDNTLRHVILAYLRRLQRELNIPLLVISHDLPDIQRLTNHVYLINKGQCVGHGSVYELFGQGGFSQEGHELVNVLNLVALTEEAKDGVYNCLLKDAPSVMIKTPFVDKKEFSVVIHPREIALSIQFIQGISMQNQLKGVITRFVEKGDGVYCFIDAGVTLAAEVTQTAIINMNLALGNEVYCLFKAHSLRTENE
ncbi:molybdenum ABC transporter ATP-binding protein [Spirochaeta cellobiosiphila]|uniref:molybdenum ABC transporter ATP-binding protein n=1 Tax=Spirochaeta cellobiosiphila TaxID=504483 RepID=UPI0004114441|nr:ATP-binding cassette domain-containing protein [Spirochaeta cellobiosiphila]